MAVEPTNVDPDAENSGWVPAPADSHVAQFCYIDNRNVAIPQPSELYVTFKGTNTQKRSTPDVTYIYTFYDHATGKAVFEALCGAESPGTVVWSELKRKGVQYRGPL